MIRLVDSDPEQSLASLGLPQISVDLELDAHVARDEMEVDD